ncbi:L-aspartate 1-decarboxylase [Neorhodopirellula lusitana]|uniref:Aspartate 1-decarboxylase n=1 Tax=Neorhodopirellula lusitana TaxID=445327 RepID=A0ABY1PNU1_9BACT|nr:aspartate 1-decarboxylase [Neorhodopirellula lusitana]SMP40202.1 L-aspartate 1-decarboxylase [Neorhodopirellula lusitana]
MDSPYRKLLAAKIHRATVTGADVNYEGSMTVPPELLAAAGISVYESLHVWNVTRGSRLETYAIEGLPGSHDICANGAAAHLIRPGDHVILAAYAMVPEADAKSHKPKLIFVNEKNEISHTGPEIPGPQIPTGPRGGDSASSTDASKSGETPDVDGFQIAAAKQHAFADEC